MTSFKLKSDLYLYPTPAGAYYAVSAPDNDTARKFLRSLLQFNSSPLLTLEVLQQWTDLEDENDIAELLNRLQNLGWLQACETPQHAPNSALEDILPELLAPLSNRGNVLLADNLGFHIAYCGFNYETVEQLSALSAAISSLHERHIGLLERNLGLNTSAWAVVDAAGNSQIGFWPIYIGKHRFILIIGGMPRLNQIVLTTLIWTLSIRYGEEE